MHILNPIYIYIYIYIYREREIGQGYSSRSVMDIIKHAPPLLPWALVRWITAQIFYSSLDLHSKIACSGRDESDFAFFWCRSGGGIGSRRFSMGAAVGAPPPMPYWFSRPPVLRIPPTPPPACAPPAGCARSVSPNAAHGERHVRRLLVASPVSPRFQRLMQGRRRN
jgi:hypothetical protein